MAGFPTPQHTPNAGKMLKKTLRLCILNPCQCLADKINDLVNAEKTGGSGMRGLVSRFAQQVMPGASGPGTDSWVNHELEIQRQQENLRQHLQEYNGRGCGGGPGEGIPIDAEDWAVRPLPTPSEWGVNNPVNTYQGITGSATGDAAAGVATVSVGYLIWRGIRMIPSLFPPLWETIPANLAIP